VGLVQLLVYVGAIVVLVLFALMLTRAPIGPHAEIDTPWWQRLAGALLGAATTALLAAVLLPIFSGATADLDTPTTTTPQVAQAVFGTWVWPFELLSVLLLVALIGAFAVSRLVLHRDSGEVLHDGDGDGGPGARQQGAVPSGARPDGRG
jgi:NADH-quinone oxidoreductase subunit J